MNNQEVINQLEKTIGIIKAIESGRIQVMDCTGCMHKGNKQFCLNCKRGGCRDYYLAEDAT